MQFGTLLDVAIILVTLYAGLSCVCSFVNEQIAGFLSLRGEKLYTGVLNLVSGNRALTNSIFEHPLVDSATNDDRGLIRNWRKDNRPSYIDSRNFSLAFWQSIELHANDSLTAKEAADRSVQAQSALGDAETEVTQAKAAAASPNATADAAVRVKTATNARDKALTAADTAAKLEDAAKKSEAAETAKQQAEDKAALAEAQPSDVVKADAEAAAKEAAERRKDADDARAMFSNIVAIVNEPKDALDSLRQAAAVIPDPKLKSSLAALLNQSGADYDALLKSTEDWFNTQMDRVTGWYRRQSQYALIAIAIVIVVASGIDSIEIAQRFYASPTLLDATTAAIKTAYASERTSSTDSAANDAKITVNQAKIRTAAQNLVNSNNIQQFFHPFGAIPTANQVAADQNNLDAKNKAVADLENAKGTKQDADTVSKKNAALADANVAAANAKEALARDTAGATITRPMRWLGMFLTVLALSLGGPFWFDTLGKLMNVRLAGVKPDDTPKKQTA